MTLDDAITEVTRARKRLEDEQGRLARRNARTAVKAAVATALRAMDREFPLIRKERVVKVSMSKIAKTRRERRARLRTLTTTVGISNDVAVLMMNLGVPVTRNKLDGSGNPNAVPCRAPAWAVKAYEAGVAVVSHDQIKLAVRSRSVRARIAAVLRLRSTTP